MHRSAPPSRRLPYLLLLIGLAACAHTQVEAPEEDPEADVEAEDIAQAPQQPIEKYLEGRVSGVRVVRVGGGIAVLIRGGSSIHGPNAPLYVLNGLPILPGPNGVLTGINPYDIQSIEVLKDAEATAFYGIRGANGVVVITTKQH